MKKILLIASSIIATTFSANIFADSHMSSADTDTWLGMPIHAMYAGVKGGYQDFKLDKGGYPVRQDHYFMNIHGGYLMHLDNGFAVGPQVGFSYYGGIKSNPLDLKINLYSINVYAVGRYKFEQYYLSGRLGAVYGIASGDGAKSSLLFAAGLGAGYFITKNFSAGITYDHIFGKSCNGVSSSEFKFPAINAVGVTVDYHF